jgi:hypothetical protein
VAVIGQHRVLHDVKGNGTPDLVWDGRLHVPVLFLFLFLFLFLSVLVPL